MWWYDTKEKHQYSKASLNKVPKSFVAKVVKFKAHGLFITQEWKTAHSRNFIPSNKLIFTRLNLYSPVLIFFFFPFLLIKLFYLFLRNKQNIYTTLKSLIWCNTIYDTTHMNIKIDNIHVKPHFFQFMWNSVSIYTVPVPYKKRESLTDFTACLINCNMETCDKGKAAWVCSSLPSGAWTKLWPPSRINCTTWTGNIIRKQNREIEGWSLNGDSEF